MVSIHKVPVIVHLIIRVISSTFRFKRGASLLLVPLSEGSRIARFVETSNAKPHAVYYCMPQSWLYTIHPNGALRCFVFNYL